MLSTIPPSLAGGRWALHPGDVRNWLTRHGNGHFTASAKAAAQVFQEIEAVKRSLGLDDVVHQPSPNPMLFFIAR